MDKKVYLLTNNNKTRSNIELPGKTISDERAKGYKYYTLKTNNQNDMKYFAEIINDLVIVDKINKDYFDTLIFINKKLNDKSE